ncbi:ubiquitin-conjugating enzyme 23 isoform X2 [Wolffia australiana]
MENDKVQGVMAISKEDTEKDNAVKQQVSPSSPIKQVYIYRQDIVKSNKSEDLLGVVLEVSGDSDSDGDVSDSSDVENDEQKSTNDTEHKSVADSKDAGITIESQGEVEVRVMWINGSETTENHGDIAVVDRELLHGDIVASISDPTGQLGLVLDVHMSVDLLSSNGETTRDVPSKELKRIRDFTAGDYVIHGAWLGRVDDVLDNVTVQLDDGSICKVMKADPLRLKPVSQSIAADSGFPYYPGQRVRAVSSYVLKNSRWLSGSWKSSHVEGTVTNVQAASVFVYWMASATTGTGDSSAAIPSEEQNPKNLTLLSCYVHSNWQLGDWCMFPVSQVSLNRGEPCAETSDMKYSDDLSSLDTTLPSEEKDESSGPSSHTASTKEHAREAAVSRKKLRKIIYRKDKKQHRREESFQKAYFVACTRTKVDVIWQDGTKEFSVKAKSLIPIQSPGDHEFFPEQYVAEQVTSEGDDPYQVKRIGVIRTINAKERTACVRWLKPVSRPEDMLEFDNEEVVSVYELVEHPDYDYCYGDLVVRLTPPAANIDYHSDEANAVESDSDFSSLSWVGHVTGLHDGSIEVSWADGMVSSVGPQAIYVVGREDGESFNGGSEVSDDGGSWETIEENDMAALDAASEEIVDQPSNENSVDEESRSIIPKDQTDAGRKEEKTSPSDEDAVMNTESHVTSHGSPTTKDSACSIADGGGLSLETGQSLDTDDYYDAHEEKDVESSCHQSSCGFKHFDLAKEPLDHHFLDGTDQSVCGRKWTKNVQKEWSILDKNLPDAIFVRVFEDRMDLLRAVIIGACGTPYQDGLFFFDFFLPPEYPQVPPSAYYHSGGLRINPNLYEEGKVCLSLLNTWTGKGNEVWDPNSSSILQVLVSIQGLVLNSRPYFNEAGYEKQVGTAEGEKNAYPYNENTYLLNLRSMLYLLRRPPMHFEDFVKDHFRSRGKYILKACDAYMKGCPVGSLTKDGCMSSKSGDEQSSVGFKLMLAKIMPKLFAALKDVGADCGEFEHLCGS